MKARFCSFSGKLPLIEGEIIVVKGWSLELFFAEQMCSYGEMVAIFEGVSRLSLPPTSLGAVSRKDSHPKRIKPPKQLYFPEATNPAMRNRR